MAKVLWFSVGLLLVQTVHSYILLTANIDDLRNIGKQLLESPIVGQVGGVARRAFSMFSDQLMGKSRARMRASDEDILLSYHPEDPDKTTRKPYNGRRYESDSQQSKSKESNETGGIDPVEEISYSNNNNTFSSLGKSASIYLDKIKKIFQNEQIASS